MPTCFFIKHCTPDLYPMIPEIRWLGAEEREVFCAHLRLCGQADMTPRAWDEMTGAGIRYLGYFLDGEMVGRACIERIADDRWEVADVRVAREYRNRGIAEALCKAVINEIFADKCDATIRTEAENAAMLRVIEKLCFEPLEE